jgi:hypothetical protein
MISDEQLDVMERYYTPAEDQKCRVCGAPLQLAGSELGESVYHCSSDAASPVRREPGTSVQEQMAHWRNSRWRDRGQASFAVTELIRAYRELLTAKDAAGELRMLRAEIERDPMDLISITGSNVMDRVLRTIDEHLAAITPESEKVHSSPG